MRIGMNCNKTFCSISRLPCYGLHDRRSVFDEGVEMSVHGMPISPISKIKKMAWNPIARWLKVTNDVVQRLKGLVNKLEQVCSVG